ncbi:MAG: efflux transporter periplasmic adaptor subunit [Bacteroidetes bacterium]|nr:efflux transporter periplasmic adaptor subunit [Bacteroidota bacterium]
MDRIIEDKRWIKPKHYKYIAGAILAVAIILFITLYDQTSTFRAEKEKITIEQVKQGEFNDYITITGQVVPIATIFLDAIEGGRVEEILIEEGAMLSKDDVILRLHNNDLIQQIMNSESNLAYSSNELRNTRIQMEQQKIQNKRELLQIDYQLIRLKRNYRQNKALYQDELIAREEYLRSQEEFEKARSNRELVYQKLVQDSIFRENQKELMDENLKNMQLNLQMVRQRLGNLHVQSPVKGQLGLLNVEIGELISKGQRIGQVNILESFKINADIDEHYIDRIRLGLHGYFDRQQDTFGLLLKKQYPEVRDGRFEVDLVFRDSVPRNIRIGQTYHIKLELGLPQQAVLIPRGGFFQSTGGQWVYVLHPTGEYALKRNIRIGRQNPQYYEVLSGLEPGEQVITSNYDVFGENERIVFK